MMLLCWSRPDGKVCFTFFGYYFPLIQPHSSTIWDKTNPTSILFITWLIPTSIPSLPGTFPYHQSLFVDTRCWAASHHFQVQSISSSNLFLLLQEIAFVRGIMASKWGYQNDLHSKIEWHPVECNAPKAPYASVWNSECKILTLFTGKPPSNNLIYCCKKQLQSEFPFTAYLTDYWTK